MVEYKKSDKHSFTEKRHGVHCIVFASDGQIEHLTCKRDMQSKPIPSKLVFPPSYSSRPVFKDRLL